MFSNGYEEAERTAIMTTFRNDPLIQSYGFTGFNTTQAAAYIECNFRIGYDFKLLDVLQEELFDKMLNLPLNSYLYAVWNEGYLFKIIRNDVKGFAIICNQIPDERDLYGCERYIRPVGESYGIGYKHLVGMDIDAISGEDIDDYFSAITTEHPDIVFETTIGVAGEIDSNWFSKLVFDIEY